MLSKMAAGFVNHATGVGNHFPGAQGAVKNADFCVNHATEVGDHIPGA